MIDLAPYKDKPSHMPKQAVVTIRMSGELHKKLKALAHREHLSGNKLMLALLEIGAKELEAR